MAVRAVITIVSLKAGVTLDPLARNPVPLDAVGLGDLFVRVVTYQRGYTDQARAGDTINARDLGKRVADTAGATDDLNGALGADDDQNITFAKAVNRVVSVSDVDTLLVSKPVSDGSLAGEQALMAFGKPVADALAAGDAASRTAAYARTLPRIYALDYFESADYLQTDAARATDALSRTFQASRAFTRTAAATDSLSRAFGAQRAFSRTAGASDALARVLDAQRQPTHTAGASDANRTDAIGLALPRAYATGYFASPDYVGSDFAHATDALVDSFGKNLSRTARATDAGVMALPGGYASGYFALDYVNPVRTW